MITADEATWDFISRHQDVNVNELALKKKKFTSVNIDFALSQIYGRQKTKLKLPRLFTFDKIVYPMVQSLEQCSSELTANYKASLLSGNTFCDLSGGFGIDAIAFAQHFAHGIYVEPDHELCEIFRHNLDILGICNVEIAESTMEDYLPRLSSVDLLYLDPSRRDSNGQRVVSFDQCSPNILQYYSQLKSKTKNLMVKASPMIDIKRSLAQLSGTTDVHVISVRRDCREVLFVVNPQNSGQLYYHAAYLHTDKEKDCFSFTMEEELQSELILCNKVKQYLYEPNSAILKAGAFKLISNRFNVEKLHVNSHLYTSSEKIDGFPGRRFELIKVYDYSKDGLRNLSQLKYANIATRNFPLGSDELRKKLKLSDGSDDFLYGTTVSSGKKVIIHCRKIS